MKFDDAVSNILNESPFGDVGEIRSSHFTTDIPPKAKFKKGDVVSLRGLDMATNPAFRKYGRGALGAIVGMQRNTGPGRTAFGADPMNRYYVQFEDEKIYPVSSFHLDKVKKGSEAWLHYHGRTPLDTGPGWEDFPE